MLRLCFRLLAVLGALGAPGAATQECPAPCDCLERYVECSGRRLTALEAVPRWAERLYLNRNRLRALPPLVGLDRLEGLEANRNEISELDGAALPASGSLRSLDLSHNRIESVAPGSLAGLAALRDLRLDANRISALPADAFRPLTRLVKLQLNENRLSAIRYHAFRGLESLTTLELKSNTIENVTSGAFVGFKAIESLALDRNEISIVSKGWMYGLESLKIMSLSYNAISKIDYDSWELNGNLEVLDLSHNRLRSLDGRTFKHLKNLKSLNLNGNKIASITQDSFGHTPLLRTLLLDDNKISWTVEDMTGPFSKLHNLVKFSLMSNQIKSINSRAFEGLSNVEVLDLRGNNITSIQRHAFKSMTSIKKFHLNSSSLLCDCNLRWILKWIRSHVKQGHVTATCAYPAELRGHRIGGMKDVKCGNSPKPSVLEHPKTQKAIKGNSTHLMCIATSNPFSNMTFSWQKNNGNISNPIIRENKTITDTGQKVAVSELIIPNITHSDDGKYQCLVSNTFGTTYSNKAEIKMVIFPRFTKVPTNVTVRTGETVSLICAATGDPVPEISWKKDGGNDFPAARERRMNVMPADHKFYIVGAKTEDMGVYSCAAKNSGGTIISNATLSVYEPPSVSQHMERKVAAIGEEVVIPCMISGSPKPELKWLKDGDPIDATERHFFTAEGLTYLLIIVQAKASDAGTYVCEITNSLGTDRGLTELSVISASEDMTGIIIITVVCCAVGTSMVWVVIIYQSRRRTARSVTAFPTESIKMTSCPIDSDTGAQLYSDTGSERSSCKDSGTGDSAKQGSFDGVPNERTEMHFETICKSYSPVSEAHKLLPSSFKPSIQVCVNTSISPATYSFSSHSDKDIVIT